ncbi:MAG: aconitate hydratase [Syntrophobacterales bacterium]|jgi:aconitate hydratase|nr:aconitate hydratase [Syntrophobacterales bacterium]
MAKTIVEQIMAAHLVSGELVPGAEVALKIDHTLTQDATGTLAYLEFEAMGVARAKPEVAVSFVDHNLPQTDFRNADDHRFLRTVAAKYGLYFSPPGNGISHQVHLERFSAPGKTLLGSDSHTPTAGGGGMLAFGAGGLDVALALAGQPFYLVMPEIIGVKLIGRLRPWTAAKDVILELLRRLTVKGGRGKILEFFGPALRYLSVPERASITNMGAELGATTSIFPSDAQTRKFLQMQGRKADFQPVQAQGRPRYAEVLVIDLDKLEPLIAQPSSPDRVAPVKDLAGTPVEQVLIGSCANSSLRDLMIVSQALKGRRVHPGVSLEINPGSRQVLENLILAGGLLPLLEAGARVMPPGCWGCIGMGQAPPTNAVSVRTFPRNFPGRSGTKDDKVYLSSPETAVAAAIFGELRDPRDLGDYPRLPAPRRFVVAGGGIIPPPPAGAAGEVVRGPNIVPFPQLTPLPETWRGEVWLKVGDNVTTDDILPAGSQILPLRSNLPAISQYAFTRLDPEFPSRVQGKAGEGAIIGGENYGQGSSREHAALAPRYLGVRVKLVKTFARIHLANLINFGILPLTFENPADYALLTQGQTLELPGVKQLLLDGAERLPLKVGDREIWVRVDLSARQRRLVAVGGALNLAREA